MARTLERAEGRAHHPMPSTPTHRSPGRLAHRARGSSRTGRRSCGVRTARPSAVWTVVGGRNPWWLLARRTAATPRSTGQARRLGCGSGCRASPPGGPWGTGPSKVWPEPSVEAKARGWAAATTGEFRPEVRELGRGKRRQTSTTDLFVPVTWPLSVEVTRAERWVRRSIV